MRPYSNFLRERAKALALIYESRNALPVTFRTIVGNRADSSRLSEDKYSNAHPDRFISLDPQFGSLRVQRGGSSPGSVSASATVRSAALWPATVWSAALWPATPAVSSHGPAVSHGATISYGPTDRRAGSCACAHGPCTCSNGHRSRALYAWPARASMHERCQLRYVQVQYAIREMCIPVPVGQRLYPGKQMPVPRPHRHLHSFPVT